MQRICAAPACQHVVARTANQRLVARRPGQLVGKGRTDDLLDPTQRIAFGKAAACASNRQIDGNACVRPAVVGGIDAGAAVERICAARAEQLVVAAIAAQRFVENRTIEHVGIGRSGKPLDPAVGIARSIAAAGRTAIETGDHASARAGIVRHVKTCAAFEHIRAACALQNVIAAAARQCLVARAASDAVGKGRAHDPFDLLQGVALRIAAQTDRSIVGNHDPGCRSRIIGRIDACAAEQLVCAHAAAQIVVASATRKAIGKFIASQHIVERGPGHPLDAREPVACRIAALPCRTVERDGHCRCRRRIVRQIEADAADQRIAARATCQNIVARAAIDAVAAAIAGEPVIIA